MNTKLINEKTDISEYSDSELSMLVMNDETLYSMRYDSTFLTGLIPNVYIYTAAQFEELENDLAEELKEEEEAEEREEAVDSQCVKELLASMMLENTGKAICDSGGDSGRMWQRNQQAMDGKNPVEYLESMDSISIDSEGAKDSTEIDFTINIFHYLKDQFSLDSICYDFNKLQNDSNDWDADLEMYGVSENAGNLLDIVNAEIGSAVNTYNGDSRLSQVLQYTHLTINEECYVSLQIHQGADVRGGYTDAKLFKLDNDYDYDGGFLNPQDVHGCIIDSEEEYFDICNTYDGWNLNDENGQPVEFGKSHKVELHLSGE